MFLKFIAYFLCFAVAIAVSKKPGEGLWDNFKGSFQNRQNTKIAGSKQPKTNAFLAALAALANSFNKRRSKPKTTTEPPATQEDALRVAISEAVENPRCFWEFGAEFVKRLKNDDDHAASIGGFAFERPKRWRPFAGEDSYHALVFLIEEQPAIEEKKEKKEIKGGKKSVINLQLLLERTSRSAKLYCPEKVIKKMAWRMYPLFSNAENIMHYLTSSYYPLYKLTRPTAGSPLATFDEFKDRLRSVSEDLVFHLEKGKIGFMGFHILDATKVLEEFTKTQNALVKGNCDLRFEETRLHIIISTRKQNANWDWLSVEKSSVKPKGKLFLLSNAIKVQDDSLKSALCVS